MRGRYPNFPDPRRDRAVGAAIGLPVLVALVAAISADGCQSRLSTPAVLALFALQALTLLFAVVRAPMSIYAKVATVVGSLLASCVALFGTVVWIVTENNCIS
jgi:hypothetical protein